MLQANDVANTEQYDTHAIDAPVLRFTITDTGSAEGLVI